MSGSFDVELAGVSKSFGTMAAVREVDLSIPRATVFSLLGPSGCGKTTTLRLIAGFEQPTRGEVFIRGQRVTAVPPYKRDFSMVFQSYALFPHLTVAQNVGFGLRMRRVGRAERDRAVAEALDLVKLGALAERYPRQLSGGQQQRVALARAVVVKPAVLLLDEPLGALDKNLREEMQVEIRQLQQRLDITAVFVTHDQEEALTMSDTVAVMRNGEIEQLGAPREIYDHPRTEFVAGFLGASNFFDARLVGREGGAAILDLAGEKLRAADPAARAAGEVRLAVRPERIALKPATEPGLRARIANVIYRGPVTQIYLESPAGPIVAYRQNASPAEAALAPGAEMSVDWEPDSAVILAGGPAR